MKMEVNEFIYDICEEIYEELCRLNCNKNISESILIDNINDIVDNKLINISTYEYNVRDTWFNLVLTAEFGSDTSKQQIYIDGVSVRNFSAALSSLSSNTDIYFYLGQYYSSTWGLTKGSWSNVNVYNRYLEPSEIKQNYNALKGRFL